jgi:hypothetical protein
MSFFRKHNIFNRHTFTDALHKKKKAHRNQYSFNKAERDGSQSQACFDTNK